VNADTRLGELESKCVCVCVGASSCESMGAGVCVCVGASSCESMGAGVCVCVWEQAAVKREREGASE